MRKIYVKLFIVTVVGFFIWGGSNFVMADTKTISDKNKENTNMQSSKNKEDLSDKNIMVINLEHGKVFIKLLPELAPNHVKRIKKLANAGFYDGVIFHRVIANFMAQTGDPTGTGKGGSGQNIKAEFSDAPFVRSAVGMARTENVDSADSQFFIMLADGRFLDGQYTLFGKVISGMEYVDKIKKGEPPANPDKILWARVISEDEMQMEKELEAPNFVDDAQRPDKGSKSK